MSLQNETVLLVLVLLCTLKNQITKPLLDGQNNLSQTSKIYYTLQERKDLFVDLGVQYLNTTCIDYEHIFNADPRQSEIYLRAMDYHNYLTALYGADIAACTLIPISIRWLGLDIGYGAFAEDDVMQGDFIGIYAGVVQDRMLIDNTDYAWLYPISTLDGTSISLSGAEKGNELRFINDGQYSNCVAKYVIGLDDVWHICYIASENIKKGDQLSVNYGSAYWNYRKKQDL